ncbi:unnamed protein product [Heterobilharzia americana]|nr:unnamed protein product [Heterobilharzia americana]CAH8618726.1 unnamed protein product [Heterobilharzia americana]
MSRTMLAISNITFLNLATTTTAGTVTTEESFWSQMFNAFTTALVLKAGEYTTFLTGSGEVIKTIHSILFNH